MNERIAETLKVLPDAPGVYIMHDAAGRVIYVGKAVILKNRVRSYFRKASQVSPKVRAINAHVDSIETIVCASEMEALILECNLIKKYRPRYNIELKDDKTYPYLKITVDEAYPRMYITRRVQKDGAKNYGPNADGITDYDDWGDDDDWYGDSTGEDHWDDDDDGWDDTDYDDRDDDDDWDDDWDD